jgi:hypothetical protein
MFEKDGRDESTQDGGSYASGFVVKLFQMVQDAPDDVISVSYRPNSKTRRRPSRCCSRNRSSSRSPDQILQNCNNYRSLPLFRA